MMKKIFAAALATAMVASMAVSSFAAPATDGKGVNDVNSLGMTESDSKVTYSTATNTPKIGYGKTLYYGLNAVTGGNFVTEPDAIKGVSPKATWSMNGAAVESVTIVKKKYSQDEKYYYFLAVKTKANATTATTDVAGKINLKKTSPANYKFDVDFTIDFSIGYGEAFGSTNPRAISDSTKIYDFGSSKLGSDEEDTLTFDGGEFVVNTVGQSKLLLYVDTKYNGDVAAKYPAANLDFVNFNGASFNKIGELTFEDMAGKFLYSADADGNLTAVKGTYDEYAETLTVKTRNLGKYVISDVELKVVTTPTTPEVKPNPGTGANA